MILGSVFNQGWGGGVIMMKESLVIVIAFFLVCSHAFTVDEILIAGISGCPCPDEVACKKFNTTEITCIKLCNVDACEGNPSGIAECVPCVNSGLQWCPMNFSETNSAICAKDCSLFKNRFPNLFNGSDPITCTDQCPNELLCPDCVSDDQTDVKIVICHKPGTPAEKTLKVPPPALGGHLGHGDTIGPCRKRNHDGDGGDDDDDDDDDDNDNDNMEGRDYEGLNKSPLVSDSHTVKAPLLWLFVITLNSLLWWCC